MPASDLLNYLLANEPQFTPSRLPSLYSDLSVQRTTNPEGFAANAAAWTSALTRLALAAQLPSESLFVLHTNEELLSALSSRQYGRPVGLGVVLDNAVKEGKMMSLKTFEGVQEGIYERKSWLRIPSVGEVVRWSLRQIGVLGNDSFDVDGRLRNEKIVVIPALEEVGRRVVQWQSQQGRQGSLTGRILGREEFGKEIAKALDLKSHEGIKSEDVDVLLKYLQRDKGVLSYNSTTVKFKSPNTTTPEPITQEDPAIANLQTVITNLTAQVQQLEEHIARLQAKATNAVKNKNNQSAMSALRSKTLATKQLEQRTATLQQLEDAYAQIENAASQVDVVATLKESAGVLRGLNRRVGDVGRVEDVMESLREEMGRTSEVQGVLNEPLAGDGAVVDGEVDEEFEAMEREEVERREKEEAERVRVRLGELEREEGGAVPVPEKAKEHGSEADGERMDVDEELAKSVEKMEGMSLGERDKETADRNQLPA